MTTGPRLIQLELEAFRGFAAPRTLDLNADVILVRGDNGTGKTSVVDALLWLFTGVVPRLAERVSGRRKGNDPLLNCYCAGNTPRVRLTVQLTGGQTRAFERTGGMGKSVLTAWQEDRQVVDAEGLLAETYGASTSGQIAQSVGSWGILQQNALLAALDSGDAMHQRLAEVVGLDRVTAFTVGASEAAKRVARELKHLEGVQKDLVARRSKAVAELAAARASLKDAASQERRLTDQLREATSELPDGLDVLHVPSSVEAAAALGRGVQTLVGILREVASHHNEFERVGTAPPDALQQAETDLAVAARRAESAMDRAPTQVQLATAALEMLGDTCPVCRQPIDEPSVHAHLSDLLQSAQREAQEAHAARDALARARARFEEARRTEDRRSATQAKLDSVAQRFDSALAATPELVVDPLWRAPGIAMELASHLDHLYIGIRAAEASARQGSNEQVARLVSEVEAFDVELTRLERELSAARDRKARAAALNKAAQRAAERIVQRALERLAPSFAEVFDRLTPHPTFTQLRAAQDIFYGKNQVIPEVYDPTRKIAANPSLLFSEGQLNVVALSYFLGLALNATDVALPFIVLDDPLQSMDVLSVLGFADLCRRLREHRQLVVTTHDRRFASLLARKLAPREEGRRTVMHEFEGWTDEGPHVRTTDEPLADVLPLLARRAS